MARRHLSLQERQNPEVFFQPGPRGRKALARWALAARKTEQELMDFLVEYRTMKSMFGKLGKGEDFAEPWRGRKTDWHAAWKLRRLCLKRGFNRRSKFHVSFCLMHLCELPRMCRRS